MAPRGFCIWTLQLYCEQYI